jgi:hypothetical protein
MPDLDLITAASDIWKLKEDITEAKHGPIQIKESLSIFSILMLLFGIILFFLILAICFLKYRSFQSHSLTRGLMHELHALRPAAESGV